MGNHVARGQGYISFGKLSRDHRVPRSCSLCCPDLLVTFEFSLLALRTSGGGVEPLLTSGGGNAPAVQSPGPAPTQLWFRMSDKGRLSLQPRRAAVPHE